MSGSPNYAPYLLAAVLAMAGGFLLHIGFNSQSHLLELQKRGIETAAEVIGRYYRGNIDGRTDDLNVTVTFWSERDQKKVIRRLADPREADHLEISDPITLCILPDGSREEVRMLIEVQNEILVPSFVIGLLLLTAAFSLGIWGWYRGQKPANSRFRIND